MKKTLIIAVIVVCASSILISCKGNIDPAKSSMVTISVGSDKVASVNVKPATAWAMLKLRMANLFATKDAMAAIPSIVQTVKLTIDAADMPAISESQDVTRSTTPIVSFTVIVPNGPARHFVVDGLDSTKYVYYRGETQADLTGEPATLSITMLYWGPGIYVSVKGDDNLGDGSLEQPYRTITRALSAVPGAPKPRQAGRPYQAGDPVVVGPGVYDDITGGEIFPITLGYNTPLISQDPKHLAVIDGGNAGTVVLGNYNATIDNFIIIVPCDGYGIDDNLSHITVNNVRLTSPDCANYSIYLNTDSLVTNSTFSGGGTAIYINSGNPVIQGNTIIGTSTEYMQYGIAVFGGAPTIQDNIIIGNYDVNNSTGIDTGIYIGTPAGATITGNIIRNNNAGIVSYVLGTGVSTLSTNTIINNFNTGVTVAAGDVDILNNSIQSNGSGISFSSVGVLHVSGSKISQNVSDAIAITSAGTATIDGNVIANNGGGAILVSNPALATISSNTIRNNGGGGIYSATTGSLTISGNTIVANTPDGINVWAGMPLIENNTIGNHTGRGIIVDLSAGPTISANRISSNGTGIHLTNNAATMPTDIHYNSVSCNNTADLRSDTTTLVYADANHWDYTEPTLNSLCASGIDICGTSVPSYDPTLSPVPAASACYTSPIEITQDLFDIYGCGGPVTFTANGGVPPYTWSTDDPTAADLTVLNATQAQWDWLGTGPAFCPNDGTITVTVTDSKQNTISASVANHAP